MHVAVRLNQANANDTVATLVQWVANLGSWVEQGQPIALFETTKATYEVEAPAAGWLIGRAELGDVVEIGATFAELAAQPPEETAKSNVVGQQRRITVKARRIMDAHGISETQLPAGLALVREQDILSLIEPTCRGAETSSHELLERADYRQLLELLRVLRQRMKGKFERHVPTGTLLNDRWGLAEYMGFGKNSSVYDESLILGDVKVGANCWIGPYTVLDGSGGRLEIGDWTDIGTGAHIYTHHTIDRALSGGAVHPFKAATRIGRCCFIAPMAIVAPGTEIGDHSFVATFSYAEGKFPPYSYIAGAPARVVGRIEVRDGRVIRRMFKD